MDNFFRQNLTKIGFGIFFLVKKLWFLNSILNVFFILLQVVIDLQQKSDQVYYNAVIDLQQKSDQVCVRCSFSS